MVLDHLIATMIQAQSRSTLDHLTISINLKAEFDIFQMAGKVEGKSPKTIEHYQYVADQFFKVVQHVTPATIRAYFATLQARQLSPFTIHGHYRCLKAFFNWLVREERLDRSPMWNIKAPKIPNLVIKPFATEDILAMLAQCRKGRFVDLRDRAILLIFLDTGLRKSEMANIQLADIDIEAGTIKVMGKGSKERFVRMGRAARTALLRYLLKRTDVLPCLWLSEERRPLTHYGIQQVIRRLCLYAGITGRKKGPHTLRHTSATLNRRNGMTIEQVQTMLGHSSPETTRKYLKSLDLTAEMLKAHELTSPVDRLGLR